MSNNSNNKVVVVGIDIGSESIKVVLGSKRFDCEIVRNEVGGHTTPNLISFSAKSRQIGQTANPRSKNAVYQVNRLLTDEISRDDFPFQAFYPFEFDNTTGMVHNLDYNGSMRSFSSSALLAMLFGNIHTNVQAAVQRITNNQDDDSEYEYVVSIGHNTTPKAQADWLDAAYAAGISKVKLVENSVCTKYCYQRKFPEYFSTGEQKHNNAVVVVDMGHTQTTVAVIGTTQTDDDDETTQQEAVVLSCARDKSLGAGLVDIRLWDHFQVAGVQKNSRGGQRLLEGTKKLKHLLSQLPEATVSVENVVEDKDLKLAATRTLLSELCQDDAKALKELIHKVLQEAGGNTTTIVALEVTGGGCRIPWVKDVILQAVHDLTGNNDLLLSHSLDDTSAALGAALVGEDGDGDDKATVDVVVVNSMDSSQTQSEERRQLREAEQAMAALDQDMQIRADAMNKIESHVLEMRSAKHETHGSLLPSNFDEYLMEVEDWLFSEQADNATKDDMMAKWEETKQKTGELAKCYLDALQKEKEAKDAEMEAEAKKAQEEEAGGEEAEEDDHDNRRLPKKRRMEIVMKNKAEANELFSDGNYKFAAARYTKALSHCAKFVDLNPEGVEEVNGVKLSLDLNLALAYLKLENPDQALRVCHDALAIDGENAKALYRRAFVYNEKKQWDLANKDIKKAAKVAPDDKAIKKLQDRIDAQLERQKLKQKKMAQKMFG